MSNIINALCVIVVVIWLVAVPVLVVLPPAPEVFQTEYGFDNVINLERTTIGAYAYRGDKCAFYLDRFNTAERSFIAVYRDCNVVSLSGVVVFDAAFNPVDY